MDWLEDGPVPEEQKCQEVSSKRDMAPDDIVREGSDVRTGVWDGGGGAFTEQSSVQRR